MEHAYRIKTLPVTVSGHYLVREPEGAGPHGLVMGYHGYGENARQMMKILESVPGLENCVLCSVQGVHQFYRRASGAVVASWMTWLGRERAIEVNIRYIADVIGELTEAYPENRGIAHVGFSQGAAMAFRSAFGLNGNCRGCVAFGGEVPPELAAQPCAHLPPILIGRGGEDSIYTHEQWLRDAGLLRRKCALVEAVETAGGHSWSPEFAVAAGDFVRRAFD